MKSRQWRWGPLVGLGITACGGGSGGPTGQVEISTLPLQLNGIATANYTVKVVNDDDEVVWEKALSTDDYGDGSGGIRYVGPCDADSNPNVVTLTVDSLVDTDDHTLTSDDWTQPPPIVKTVVCRENDDVGVVFNITLMRDATQGFFDIAVNFSDIFCSAKLDCRDFLVDPATDKDGLTAIAAFACTAGPGQDTTLYWGDAAIVCRESEKLDAKIIATYPVNPGSGEGNHGPISAKEDPKRKGVFASANYRTEEFPDNSEVDKCSWVTAVGIDVAALGPNCSFEATATATDTAFTAPPFHTPPDALYPVIHWSVPLTGPKSEQLCRGNYGLGSDEVALEYTSLAGVPLTVAAACDGEPFTNGIVCSGTAEGQPEITFAPVGTNAATVTYGGQTVGPFILPEGATLDTTTSECCVEPCCEETTP